VRLPPDAHGALDGSSSTRPAVSERHLVDRWSESAGERSSRYWHP
jgi:hypothetical protein